jgi:hypothetical protein
MKKYTLKVFLNDTVVTESVTAETHTIENGVYIFWVRTNNGEWAQVCTYPISCVAIARIQPADGFAMAKSDTDISRTNNTFDIEEVKPNGMTNIQEILSIPPSVSKTPKGRKK